jgi:hypothetical protein
MYSISLPKPICLFFVTSHPTIRLDQISQCLESSQRIGVLLLSALYALEVARIGDVSGSKGRVRSSSKWRCWSAARLSTSCATMERL